MPHQPVRATLELLLNRVDDSIKPADERKLGIGRFQFAERRRFRRAVLRDAIDDWRATPEGADAPAVGDDDDTESDTPILDFLRWLIESDRIQPFIAFLFDAIPKLIAAIVSIFSV
jgi:hypothetical protein